MLKTDNAKRDLWVETGSALIETVFWLLAIQVPLLLGAMTLINSQVQLARAETLVRESARATLVALEQSQTPNSEGQIQETFVSTIGSLSDSVGFDPRKAQMRVDCIPKSTCDYVSFAFKAGAETWQPQLNLLFSNSAVVP